MGLEDHTIDPAASEWPKRGGKVETVAHERGGPFLLEFVFVTHFPKGSADHLVRKPVGWVAMGQPDGHAKSDAEMAGGPLDFFAHFDETFDDAPDGSFVAGSRAFEMKIDAA